jgi:DNA polymerase-3 subunit beta
MNGVYFEITKGELRVVSTDGHRLVRIIRTNFGYDGEKTSMLVPIKTCQLMIKLFRSGTKAADTKGPEDTETEDAAETETASKDVTIYFSSEFIQCTYNNTTITSRLIDDTFPNYESVIPTENEKLLKVEKSPLLGSIKRCIIMSDQVTNKTSMVINEAELKVKASNNEFGTDSEEVIDCNFTDNEEFEIAFNGKYLLDAVQQFECDEILFNFSTPLKASILRPTEPNEDEDMIMLVMPVRNI